MAWQNKAYPLGGRVRPKALLDNLILEQARINKVVCAKVHFTLLNDKTDPQQGKEKNTFSPQSGPKIQQR